jgi:hypothetical protein
MASIQVAMRCRPFVGPGDLGVELRQTGDGPAGGEVNILNSNYTKTRYGFAYAWWSAHNHSKYAEKDKHIASDMKFITQDLAYEACGLKIKKDLLSGSAVVMFAYGLSGSGKTFTVFGPDAADSPDAWFKHAEPNDMWGILPRLAYSIFNEKTDEWKITVKYFQNVVDTVRDLTSPSASEQQYKAGMRKDQDGFMDINWCGKVVVNTWDELRTMFQQCNARKAISPTQFNHQSTRGHCVMTLEVEKPDADAPAMKQRGRLYVCDLAGTEPAGDIFYAEYKKVPQDDGSVEYQLIGPHGNQAKTKELQDQGKKINLSLSEMAQFFMKMAAAFKKGELKAGGSIPGCNSYFLCKYLKDTMMQAKTYLFCAIRPEDQVSPVHLRHPRIREQRLGDQAGPEEGHRRGVRAGAQADERARRDARARRHAQGATRGGWRGRRRRQGDSRRRRAGCHAAAAGHRQDPGDTAGGGPVRGGGDGRVREAEGAPAGSRHHALVRG